MGQVIAVGASKRHGLSKSPQATIRLLVGHGIEGDAHCGERIQHRSRARFNSSLPNLRQVHLLQFELLDELALAGFALAPIDLGENVTTRGIDLLALPRGARLTIGEAVVEVTGLRNPCVQLDRLMPGLMAACLGRDADGALVRKTGVMAVVIEGGEVRAGDAVGMELPKGPFVALQPV